MSIANFGNQILLRANCSLAPRAAVKVVGLLATLALIVALGFMHIGAWLVLPFAGLEVLAIAFAFYVVYLHSSDFESITITDDKVVIEKRIHKKITTTVFQRCWAQVNVRAVVSAKGIHGKSGIFVGSHGKEIEFGGNFINDEQRVLLARELKQKLRNIY